MKPNPAPGFSRVLDRAMTFSRFNGFRAKRQETAKAVKRACTAITGLKPGANEM